MEDPGQGGREEAVGPIVETQPGSDEQELAQRSWMEGERDLDWDGFTAAVRSGPGTGDRHERCGRRRVGGDALAEGEPILRFGIPAESKPRQPGRRLRARRRLDLGRRQQVGERIQVVADADPALGACLEGRRPAAGERIQDDVTGPRIPGDEGVRQRGRKAGQIRAHRVEGVAPQALLVLPLGRDREWRQLERQLEGELAVGGSRRGSRHWAIRDLMHPRPDPDRGDRARSIARRIRLSEGRGAVDSNRSP